MRRFAKNVIFVLTVILIVSGLPFAALAFENTENVGEVYAFPTKTDIGKEQIHFIRTGQSDCTLVESAGHFGLIDTSYPSDENGDDNVSVVIDYLEELDVDSLDFIIATHPHSDHIGGIPEIAEDYVDSNTQYIYKSYIESNKSEEKAWNNAFYYNKAQTAMTKAGAKFIDVTDKSYEFYLNDVCITLFNTEKGKSSLSQNDMSLGALINIGNKKVFVSGDITNTNGVEEKIAEKIGEIDVLKACHHSFLDSNSPKFIATLNPQDTIITNNVVDWAFYPASCYLNSIGSKVYLISDKNVTYNTAAVVMSVQNNRYTLKNAGSPYVYDGDDGWFKWSDATTPYLLTYIKNGRLLNGWQTIDECKFYFDDIGILKDGWQNTDKGTYYIDREKGMLTGWQEISSKTYYFDENGLLQTGFKYLKRSGEYHWFYFNNSGEMLTGWQELSRISGEKNHYYFNGNGEMLTGWQTITSPVWEKNKLYLFDSDGALLEGFQTLTRNGRTGTAYMSYKHGLLTGWQNDIPEYEGKKFYFDEDGFTDPGWHDDIVDYEGKWIYFNENGELLTGWQSIETEQNTEWFYFDQDGQRYTGWHSDIPGWGNSKFYFDQDGRMQTGWHNDIDGYIDKWIYFNESGVMQKGWQCLNWSQGQDWFYFDQDGILKTGFVNDAINWEGKWFYFNKSGVMQKAWQNNTVGYEGKWFYFADNGVMLTGWQQLPSSDGVFWYYFADNGIMLEDTTTPDGFYVDRSGKYIEN